MNPYTYNQDRFIAATPAASGYIAHYIDLHNPTAATAHHTRTVLAWLTVERTQEDIRTREDIDDPSIIIIAGVLDWASGQIVPADSVIFHELFAVSGPDDGDLSAEEAATEAIKYWRYRQSDRDRTAVEDRRRRPRAASSA